jgi:hypothetical protein
VKSQPDYNHLAAGSVLIRWPLVLLRELEAIAHEAYGELKRLNRGGEYRPVQPLRSRRQQTAAFKAALARRYREHNHCC